MPKVSAIVVAGGSSRRMGDKDKLFVDLGGMTTVERSVMAMAQNRLVDEVVVVASDANLLRISELCSAIPKVAAVTKGGDNRFLSVQNGVAACSPDTEYYAIHDAARPFVSDALITSVIEGAFIYSAAAPGIPITDTVKRVDGDRNITGTLDRSELVTIATPQVFEAVLYRSAAKGQSDAFDDCQLIERTGRKVMTVMGQRDNIKLTTPEDIESAKAVAEELSVRMGHGYDVHRFADDRKLILGNAEIPFERGLLGHSDADVLIHAVMDALLGAAALGDIGKLFPDTAPEFEGADSAMLLRETVRLLTSRGFRILNIDSTVVCQRPKLAPYIEKMRDNIAAACGIPVERVSVKATTEEGLGFTGSMQGIAAHAVAAVKG